eukprot:CAMPEP_0198279050 /NCGR_PEP_ID=MMETSP1447-20131203/66710_1 /TAXON_ID=420782 /ORGANISM="Chaetoceros dichaeta, Strain CCMP1751" /LENGTH=65 /DNA_ID=CAMNT_0043974179 /DNA_START=503 /DNA_END=703 /DNA_ORIENTATION=-
MANKFKDPMNSSSCTSDRAMSLSCKSGPATDDTPTSYPKLAEFNAAHREKITVERVMGKADAASS